MDNSPQKEEKVSVEAENPEDLSRGRPLSPQARPDAPEFVAIETQSQVDEAAATVAAMRSSKLAALRVLQAMEDSLVATVSVWDAASKSFVDRPDYKTRLMAVTTYLAHTVGLPIQRNENLNINAPAKQTIPYEEMLKRSPALRDAARRALERAERAAAEKE